MNLRKTATPWTDVGHGDQYVVVNARSGQMIVGVNEPYFDEASWSRYMKDFEIEIFCLDRW